jgi:ubiquinone/menaquinone biosynthesis C-methylase UbiE
MPHIFNPDDKHKLDTAERRAEMPPEKTLLDAGLRPCDLFLDIGCGTGYFALAAVNIVGPKGKVYATDISPMMLAELRSKIAAAGIFNIEVLQSGPEGEELRANTATIALLSNVLHEVDEKDAFLTAIRKALKPGGRLAVIEWQKKETPHGPPVEDRIGADRITAMLQNNGFAAPLAADLGKEHALYLAKKL